MKSPIKTLSIIATFAWLIISFGGCYYDCECYLPQVGIYCYKANDTINTYTTGTIAAMDTVKFYQSQGCKCDTSVWGYCNGCGNDYCDRKIVKQTEQSGGYCEAEP